MCTCGASAERHSAGLARAAGDGHAAALAQPALALRLPAAQGARVAACDADGVVAREIDLA